jgi:hypothetical protein
MTPDDSAWQEMTLAAVQVEGPHLPQPSASASPAPPVVGNGPPLPTVPDEERNACFSRYPLDPVGDVRWAVEIRWDQNGPPDVYSREKPPCDVVRDYVNAIWPRLTVPPLRSAGLTTPALALADVDPCAVVDALLPTATGTTPSPQNTSISASDPLSCYAASVRPEFDDLSVSISIGSNRRMSGAAAVAGRPSYISLDGNRCVIEFQATDVELNPYEELNPRVETMRVDVSSCHDMQKAVELAERAARLVPPTPPANPNAQQLGDLDP